MRNPDAIYVVLKIAEVCNLSCKYCYFFFAGDDTYARDPPHIRPETVDQVGAFLAQGVSDLGISTVEISLHGGEPLMVGKSRFLEMCRVLHRHVSPVARLQLSMQTNGVLLDDEWIDLLSAYEVGIGVSLDGPKHINDRERITKRGAGSYDDTVCGIELLRAAREKGLIPGFAVGCVIDPNSDAKEIYRHFVDTLRLDCISFRPPIMDWTSFDQAVVDKVNAYLDDIVSAWLADNNPNVRVEFLSRVLGALVSDRGAKSYGHALANLVPTFSIRSDGDLCPDDALPPKDRRYRHTGFNVRDSTLAQFLAAPFWEAMDNQNVRPDDECARCKWLGICRGGPMEERYAGELRFASKTTYCQTRKTIFAKLYEAAEPIVGRATLEKRLAMSAGESFLQPN